MLYRRSPPSPPRLLLRVVVAAGAGALLGAAGCSSSSLGPEGTAVMHPDASDDGQALGFLPMSDAMVVNGLVGNPVTGDESADLGPDGASDASDASIADGGADGDAGITDAASDAPGFCHPCGVVVMGISTRPDE